MATLTPNYGLRKPDPADTVNVATDLNTPYDTIDTQLKRVDDAALAATSPNRWVRVVSAAGNYLTTSSNTELELPKLGVNNLSVVTGQLYNFAGKIQLINPTVNNDDFQVRIRTGTSFATSTERQMIPMMVDVSGLQHAIIISGYWKATITTSPLNFYVSIQRAVGTGTGTVGGDSATFFKMWLDPIGSTDYAES